MRQMSKVDETVNKCCTYARLGCREMIILLTNVLYRENPFSYGKGNKVTQPPAIPAVNITLSRQKPGHSTLFLLATLPQVGVLESTGLEHPVDLGKRWV